MSGRLVAAALALLVTTGGVAACGSDDEEAAPAGSGVDKTAAGKVIQADTANSGKSVKIGSKNFTESIILAQIYGQSLTKAGYTVKYDTNLGLEKVATAAMKKGQIDGYPEYTGTALTALLGVKPADVPKDETEAYEEAKRLYKEKLNFVALPQTPFTDSNALGLTGKRAKELGDIKTISDLADGEFNDGKLSLAASAECFKRTDCALGLKEVYGLKFKEIPIDVAQRHEVILKGKADLTIPFTTDGQIAANKEVVLEDDKDLFPPYNVTFVLTEAASQRLGPNVEKLITEVQKGLTTPVMSELNSRVDLDKQKPEKVATQYLKAQGFLE